MLGLPIVPLPTQGGGVAEIVAAVVSIAFLLVGVAFWVRAMRRQTVSDGGLTIEFPTRSQRRAA